MAQPDEQSRRNSETALSRAIWDSNEVLVQAATIFNRDILTLNRSKLFVEKRAGFRNIIDTSVRVEDVLNADGQVGAFFGTLKIATAFTKPGEPLTVGLFHRRDVLNLKRIIQGYVIAIRHKIDLNPLPTEELRIMLYQLGEDDHTVQ